MLIGTPALGLLLLMHVISVALFLVAVVLVGHTLLKEETGSEYVVEEVEPEPELDEKEEGEVVSKTYGLGTHTSLFRRKLGKRT